jgi:hypothetical protein
VHFSGFKFRFLFIGFTAIFATSISNAQKETLIPRSTPGDKGRYYLMETKKTGNVIQALHKRVGADSIVFTRTETNCKTRRMRELGIGHSPENIKKSATNWFELVPGSSKRDLGRLLCNW